MKYAGIDYGSTNIGVAISDGEGKIAFPRTVVSNDARALAQLAELIKSEQVGVVVVGDTRSTSGVANPITKDAEAFMASLSRESGIRVEPVFELWSSIEASRYAPKGQEHNDAAAAAVILQRYLDFRK